MRPQVLAGLLLLAALASYATAVWTYTGMLGYIHGRIEPGGVVKAFSVDLGTLYAGESRTVEANASFVAPGDTVITIYGVPAVNITEPRTIPPLNTTMEFNYTAVIYIDGEYRGVVSNNENLTTNIGPGTHLVKAVITVWAPRLQAPADLQLYIYIHAEG